MKYLSTILLMSFALSACTGGAASSDLAAGNANAPKVENSNKPPPEILDNDFDTALKDFVGKNYKGWQIKGVADEWGACESSLGESCFVHLSNEREDKIVTIKAEKFKKPDGHFYYQVFAAPPNPPIKENENDE